MYIFPKRKENDSKKLSNIFIHVHSAERVCKSRKDFFIVVFLCLFTIFYSPLSNKGFKI